MQTHIKFTPLHPSFVANRRMAFPKHFCFVFLAVFTVLNVHSQQVVVNGNLSWSDLDTNPETTEFGFTDAVFEPDHVDFPVFVYRTKLAAWKSVDGYRISPQEVTSVPEKMVTPGIFSAAGESYRVEAKVSDGGGKPYLVVKVWPLKKSGRSLERLVSFRLEVELIDSTLSKSRTLTFAENSVLSSGEWYKIAIARDGVYRIDRNFLTQLGVDVANVDPRLINIYGNGGSLLPDANEEPRADDLVKNSIVISGEEDGEFDNADFILFYGKGPDTWNRVNGLPGRSTWSHIKHYYSDSAYYFIRIGDDVGQRIQTVSSVADAATVIVDKFQDYQYIETDQYNLAQSGREFFGDKFDVTTSATYNFTAPNVSADTMLVEARVAVRSLGSGSTFSFTSFGQSAQVTPSAVFDSPTSSVARLGNVSFTALPTASPLRVDVVFTKSNPEAEGWLDFLRVNYMRSLVFNGTQLRFRNSRIVSPGAVAEFQLSGSASLFRVWDITDPLRPVSIDFAPGNVASFRVGASELREFVAFGNGGFQVPTAKGRVENQNLHDLEDIDLVIISSNGHLNSARELGELHAGLGLSVVVATPEQVFNEFSSGNPDPVAIRMLMKMLYDRAQGDPMRQPRNLLMFGDGDYAGNKGLRSQTGFNVMVFESEESLSPTGSYVSDDYFVFLSDDDDGSSTNFLDCGVGRIVARNTSEAAAYINKVRKYVSENTSSNGGTSCLGDAAQTPFGEWRNLITFVSDDQDGSGGAFEQLHLVDSDTLANRLKAEHPAYDIRKIYMDAYRQESTPGGERYPEASAAIKRQVQSGSLLVCYIGHGGERGWAHERVLDIPTIQSWTNLYAMPLFLTATCELARYDNPDFHSAGEILVLNPNGGAIAMLTTTRIVFSGSNFQIDTAFFSVAFDDELIDELDFGRINMLTKNGVPTGNSSKANFSLLGDPAIKMVYPRYNVLTTSINGTDVSLFVDTLKALQEVEFRGILADREGNKLTDFNGFVYPTVFDKESVVQTLNNDGGAVQTFRTYDKVIYKGAASVVNGDFSFRFVVPFDINYAVGLGRVSYYGVAGNKDAHGFNSSFRIGSVLSSAELNKVGPELDLFMNDTTFVSGGLTNTEPIFLARLKDENGINTVGTGIGHDLVAYLDGNTQDPIVLNQFYRADLDTYQSGEVRYQLTDLTPGEHNIRLRAWDVHNNSSESTLPFFVAESEEMALRYVLNYPNPFTTNTSFMFEHNQACETLAVRIQIFTVAGKLVKTIEQTVQQSGFRSAPIAWDGLDDFGDRIARGTYVYRVEARTPDGKRAEEYQKLVILR